MEGIIYRNLYDEDGAIISYDGKTLFKVPDVPRYRVPEGIEEIDIKAFKDRPNLKEIDIPYTVEWYTDYPMSNEMIYTYKNPVIIRQYSYFCNQNIIIKH